MFRSPLVCYSLVIALAAGSFPNPYRDSSAQGKQRLTFRSPGADGLLNHFLGNYSSSENRPSSLRQSLPLVRTIGTDVGPISFTQVGVAATSPSGLLAVADNGNCQIVLVNLKNGGFVRRIGRCGDGPGEFRRPAAMSFRGNLLVVYDAQRRELVFLTEDGVEQHRWSLARVLGMPGAATTVHFLDDTTLVIGRYVFPEGLAPNESAQTGRDLLVVADARTGSVRKSFLSVPDLGWKNEFRLLNHTATCTSESGRGFYLATMSMWEFGGVVFRGSSLSELVEFKTRLGWMTPVTTTQVAPGVLPGSVAFNVVCNDDGILLWAARRDLKVPGHVGSEGHMEFRSYEGRLFWAIDFGKTDTLFHERPIAAYRDRVIFRANNSGSYPRLVEFVLKSHRE